MSFSEELLSDMCDWEGNQMHNCPFCGYIGYSPVSDVSFNRIQNTGVYEKMFGLINSSRLSETLVKRVSIITSLPSSVAKSFFHSLIYANIIFRCWVSHMFLTALRLIVLHILPFISWLFGCFSLSCENDSVFKKNLVKSLPSKTVYFTQ